MRAFFDSSEVGVAGWHGNVAGDVASSGSRRHGELPPRVTCLASVTRGQRRSGKLYILRAALSLPNRFGKKDEASS